MLNLLLDLCAVEYGFFGNHKLHCSVSLRDNITVMECRCSVPFVFHDKDNAATFANNVNIRWLRWPDSTVLEMIVGL